MLTSYVAAGLYDYVVGRNHLRSVLKLEIQYLRARFLQPCSCLASFRVSHLHLPTQADNNFICILLYDVSIYSGKMPFPDAESCSLQNILITADGSHLLLFEHSPRCMWNVRENVHP